MCGDVETARVLVAHGASLEAVDKVRTHTHALLDTCCMKDVRVIMRSMRMMIDYVHACRYIHSYYMCSYIYIYMNMYTVLNLCSVYIMYIYIFRTTAVYICLFACMYIHIYLYWYIYTMYTCTYIHIHRKQGLLNWTLFITLTFFLPGRRLQRLCKEGPI